MRFPGGKSIMQTNKRPVFLTLHQIHLPLAGLVSIAHRITGVLLFLILPLVIYLLDHSLESAEGFVEVMQWLQGWPWRLLFAVMVWWFAHHLFAGLRFILIDLDIGVNPAPARHGARLVLLCGAVVLLISAVVAL
jgi:succinate dehydrogenase / fumarate reductase cytochrome b subunit